MNSQLRILFVTAEVFPFVRTGGLGDVCGTLSQALAAFGHDVRIVMPLYKTIRDHQVPMAEVPGDLEIPLVFGTRKTRVWQGRLSSPTLNKSLQPWGPRVPVYFIEQEDYFSRPGLYGGEAGDYTDNAFRFLFTKSCSACLTWTIKLVSSRISLSRLAYRSCSCLPAVSTRTRFSLGQCRGHLYYP